MGQKQKQKKKFSSFFLSHSQHKMASATSAARRFSYSSPSLFGGQVLAVAARQRNEVRNQRRLDTTRRAGKVKLEATAESSHKSLLLARREAMEEEPCTRISSAGLGSS